MNKSILYYPTIEFQQEDYKWLIRASLFWDNIYRIVPDEYVPNDDNFIKALSSSGEIGQKIYTDECYEEIRYATTAFLNDFRSLICDYNKDNPDWKDDSNQISRLNYSKSTYLFFNELNRANLIAKSESDWLYVPKFISDMYMTYLAKSIANKRGLDLSTQNSDAWMASSRIKIDRDLYDEDEKLGRYVCFPIYIKDILPLDTDIDPYAILEFREDTKEQRNMFMLALQKFTFKLENVTSIDEMREIWNSECKTIEEHIRHYKSRANVLNITRWGGTIAGFISIGLDVAEIATANPAFAIGSAVSSAIGLGIAEVRQRYEGAKNKSYSYLCQVQDFGRNSRRHPMPPINRWK